MIAAIILAAGQSRRMGSQNKLLARLNGKPLVARAVETALASNADEVLVVTGHEAVAVRDDHATLVAKRGVPGQSPGDRVRLSGA